MNFTSQTLLSGFTINNKKENQANTKILVAGDLYPGGRAESMLMNSQADSIWGDFIEEIRNHDVRIVNLEAPLTDRNEPIHKEGPHFRADPKCAFGISNGGFNIVSLANNHINDMGSQGIVETINACRDAGLEIVGAGKDLTEAKLPLYIEIGNLNIAVINICEQEFSIATNNSPGAAPLDPIENFMQIREAKERADFILVIFHGGVEFYTMPTPYMVKTCRFFIDAGADAVVCHHIHVPSGMEIYKSAPIIYSTGNFLFDWRRNITSKYAGYFVSMEVQSHQVNSLRLIPYAPDKVECSVRKMTSAQERAFMEELFNISKRILVPDRVQKDFEALVESKRVKYIAIALSLNKFETYLYRKGIWPFWRTTKMQMTFLKNTYTCSAHYYMMLNTIKNKLDHSF